MPNKLDYFRAPNETSYFDDGPRDRVRISTVLSTATSSIDTSLIDAHRQGVELTQWKHFDAGIFKIHAGEPGHVIRNTVYGVGANLDVESRFVESDRVDPEKLISASAGPALTLTNRIAMPITVYADPRDKRLYDGVIEPLTIRTTPAGLALGIPFIDSGHTVKGTLLGGNVDRTGRSDQVATIYRHEPARKPIAFNDVRTSAVATAMSELGERSNSNIVSMAPITASVSAPFSDVRYVRNVITSSTYDLTMIAALNLMTGSTDNYVSSINNSRCASAGWDYDLSTSPGADSLAFGGMEY